MIAPKPPRGTMAEIEAMWADIGYTPSAEERAALERSLPAVNAMSDREFEATLASAKAKVAAATPWGWRFFDWLFDRVDAVLDWLFRRMGI